MSKSHDTDGNDRGGRGYSRTHDAAFWQERLGTPEGVEHWHFYAYEHLDDLSFMPNARQALGDWEHAEAIVELVEARFRMINWEGTGEMQVLWFPPFAGAGPNNTFGCYALHVKQHDDGISWIASPYALPFHRLFQVDDSMYSPPGQSDWVQQGSYRKGSIVWLEDLYEDDSA